MCRLLGYISRQPVAVGDLIGSSRCDAWQQLGGLHHDGWGAAWLTSDGAPEVAKSTDPAERDPALTSAMSRQRSRASIFHMRWATKGMPVVRENTHPFLDAGLAFAHNGRIAPLGDLYSLLDATSIASLRGDTDSERYFALVRQLHREGLPLLEAAVEAVAMIRVRYPRSALNALLLSEGTLIAISASGGIPSPRDLLTKALGPREGSWPPDHARHYFDFWMLPGPESVVFSSSGVEHEGWQRIVDTVVAVDLATLSSRALPLTIPQLT